MSASREKKQRQQIPEEVKLTQAQEEQANAARRKRNKIIYSIIGAVVVILAAALLIWDSGVIQRSATVATIEGEKITGAQVAYYYYDNEIIQTAQSYSQWGITDYPFDLSKPADEQTITEAAATELGLEDIHVGKTYHEYFLEIAFDNLRQEYTLLKAAKEAGYTLSDDGKDKIDSEMDAIDDTCDQYLAYYGADLTSTAYLQMIYGSSMTEKNYRSCLENSQLASEFFTENFETLTDYTEEELRAYYEDHKLTLNTTDFYYRYFDGMPESKKDDDGNTVTPTEEEIEIAMAAAKTEAEKAQAEVDADFSVVVDNEDYTAQSGVLSPGSFYYDWLTDPAREKGDTTILDGTSGTGYYLVVFEDNYLDESHTVNLRHILISAMPEDDKSTTDTDESKNDPSEAEYAAAKEEAQKILDQWKNDGASVEDFAKLAEELSADGGSNTNGGLYEKVPSGRMIEAFDSWIFDESRQSGDTGLVQNTESSTKGWHIIYFIGEDEPVWITSVRQMMWMEDVAASVEIETTEKLDKLFA